MLVKTIEEVRKYLPVAYSAKIGKMPAIEQAEEKYLLDILGNELYQFLQDAYDENNLSPEEKKLLAKCQSVVVPFAYLLNLPFAQTNITDNGLQRIEGENARSAFRWEYNNTVNSLEDRGYSAQEALILFLKNHRADFPQWSDSPYNQPEFSIIRDGSELRSVLGLQQPHRCYLLLQSTFLTIKMLYVDELMNPEAYETLSGNIISGDLSAEEKELLKILRPACGRLAMKHAALELSLKFSGAGFTITDSATMKDNPEEGKSDPGAARLTAFAKEMEQTGFVFLEKARQYLNQKASETIFPEYFNSAFYKAPDEEVKLPYNNENRKGFFVT